MSAFEKLVLAHVHDLHPVVPFDPEKERLIPLDFTEKNQELTGDIINDVAAFSMYIEEKLGAAGARYGIGGYGEHRTVYSRSRVFDAADGEEPRRLHLGLDIWGDAGTPMFAALPATVHSFAFNDRYGDYGATIILRHELEGFVFYSLYGHLALKDLDLEAGMRVEQGQEFAHFGEPAENGHWPPHLHFQLMLDIGDAYGDYPGVCKYSEKDKYLANCPDPDLLARLWRYAAH
jgi:murein DD-endopeptidase MepM/ murein hydrolase activator NlpD